MVELLLFADLVISFFLFCALPVRLYPLTLVLCISVARTKPEELFLVHGAMFHSNNGLALVLVSICFVPKRFVLNCPFFPSNVKRVEPGDKMGLERPGNGPACVAVSVAQGNCSLNRCRTQVHK